MTLSGWLVGHFSIGALYDMDSHAVRIVHDEFRFAPVG